MIQVVRIANAANHIHKCVFTFLPYQTLAAGSLFPVVRAITAPVLVIGVSVNGPFISAGIAACTNIVVSYAAGAFFTFFTDPIGTLNALRTAALANNLTVFTTAFTALADSYATLPQTTSGAEIL